MASRPETCNEQSQQTKSCKERQKSCKWTFVEEANEAINGRHRFRSSAIHYHSTPEILHTRRQSSNDSNPPLRDKTELCLRSENVHFEHAARIQVRTQNGHHPRMACPVGVFRSLSVLNRPRTRRNNLLRTRALNTKSFSQTPRRKRTAVRACPRGFEITLRIWPDQVQLQLNGERGLLRRDDLSRARKSLEEPTNDSWRAWSAIQGNAFHQSHQPHF